MRCVLAPSAFCLLAACAGSSPAPSSPPARAKTEPPATAAAPVEENVPTDSAEDIEKANAFTLHMFADVAKNDRGDVMLSGASLRQAFGLAYVGAKGETAKEMAKTFGFAGDAKTAAARARSELDAWTKAKGEGAELTVANRIWVEKTMPLEPDFSALADGAAENVDFRTAPEEARRTINQWVATETKDKIQDLLPEGMLDTTTRAVITNAIYFKGKWVNPFAKGMTKDEPFAVDDRTKVTVPTMHVVEQFGYAHEGNVQVVELRYVGHDLSMLVVMPDDAKELSHLEEHPALATWASAVKRTRLDLAMPRFTFRWGGSVKKTLADLGVKTAFTNHADLSGMAMRPGDLTISDVVHRTWIAVDEQGTEAAAATGAVIKLTSMQTGKPTPVKVDHPFLFFVRGGGRILFVGRVTEPKQ